MATDFETHTSHITRIARLTGLAYLGIIVTGIFAEFVVRGQLIVDDDPIATASNIAESPGLFRVGIGADVVMVALDVIVAFGLYRLLRHVDRRLAVTATVLRLIQGAVIAVNLLTLVRALDYAQESAAGVPALIGPAQEALDAVERHALGYDAGLIAFGLSCLVLGRLLWMSGLVHRWLAVGMSVTGAVYLTGSFAALFAPAMSTYIEPLYVIPLAVELAFATRLIRGLDRRSNESAPSTRPVPVAA